MCLRLFLYECECGVCVKVLKEELKFVGFFSKKINDIDTILKTHKYMEHKELILICISKHTVHIEKNTKYENL